MGAASSSPSIWRYVYGGAGELAVRRALKEALCSLLVRIPPPCRPLCCCTRLGTAGAKEQPCLRSTDLVALEYADLDLTNKVSEELGHVRIRQHVNPLSSSFSVPARIPDWNQVFRDPTLPLMLVNRANFWTKELALRNVHFLFANATVSFDHLVSSYPGPLWLVSILCPDPHFKKRHRKRRVLQSPLVDSILKNLMHGGQVFIQSDVLEVALDMRNQFDAAEDVLHHIDSFNQSVLCDPEGWVLSNPMGIRTEREIHAEFEGAKIFRRLYQKWR